jgi:hypothetical protein
MILPLITRSDLASVKRVYVQSGLKPSLTVSQKSRSFCFISIAFPLNPTIIENTREKGLKKVMSAVGFEPTRN